MLLYKELEEDFSNEAGSGDSNHAAAAVDLDNPAEQGLVQALGVFVDTLVVCSATAFLVLIPSEITQGLDGMALFQKSVMHHIGTFGASFTVIIMFFLFFEYNTCCNLHYGKRLFEIYK